MPIECYQIGLVGREVVVDRYLPAAGLVDRLDFRAVSKGTAALDREQVHILDDDIVLNIVVGYVAADLIDIYVVTDSAVVDGGVSYPRGFFHPAVKADTLLENTEPHVAAEVRRPDGLRMKRVRNLDAGPVSAAATL